MHISIELNMGVKDLRIGNAISLRNIPLLWEQNDVIVLIIDLDDYEILNEGLLDDYEKKNLETLKTKYFKKRYIVSRTIMKHVISYLPGGRQPSEIRLYKDEHGKIHVSGNSELHLCISYTGELLTIAISKIRIGIDAELRKKRSINNLLKNVQSKNTDCGDIRADLDSLIMWTVKEAYSKFSNTNACYYIKKELDFGSFFHISYMVNNRCILSIVTASNEFNMKIVQLEKIDLC